MSESVIKASAEERRTIGLRDATGIGVGAIVGGGILALSGAAFAATGPSAILAFAINGVIALLTALSFAEVSTKFPYSGGTYAFAKRVLRVESAFAVGWVVWFASIVAAALYALGFGRFAAEAIAEVWGPDAPVWMTGRWSVCVLGLAATGFYALALSRGGGGGGNWINVGKLAVFAVLIAGGLWALPQRSGEALGASLTPFFSDGATGLVTAMGFTFIALQGFDLIAAVAGEVREPERTLPRAMLGSLGIALLVYLPLLFVIAGVGFPEGQHVTGVSRAAPDTVVAVAAGHYLGRFGYWLVVTAALLSMLSALQANLYAASRVAMSMARDRALPDMFAVVRGKSGVPVASLMVTAGVSALVQVSVPDLSAAGAASSLIFLVTFALVHGIAILVRRRSKRRPPPFRTPWFPLVPVLGGASCLALAVYQGAAVPSAGGIVIGWMAAGTLLFLGWFAHGARLADDSDAARDPELMTLRGRSPLILVPIANPGHAAGLVAMANALAPPGVGRVLLLSVVVAPRGWKPEVDDAPLRNAQAVLGASVAAAASRGHMPESLTTVATDPWSEIERVAETRRCEGLMLGLSRLDHEVAAGPMERLLSRVECEVVVLRAPEGWSPGETLRVLVPVGGRRDHDRLLVRMLTSLARSTTLKVTVMKILPAATSEERRVVAERGLKERARDLGTRFSVEGRVVLDDDPVARLAADAESQDLLVLGTQRLSGNRRVFGSFAIEVARATNTPLMLIARRS